MKNTVNRIIDANFNRAKEGLRVCEEITRFILNSRPLSLELKKIRHEIDTAVRSLASRKELLKERSVRLDVGSRIHAREFARDGLKDVFFANIQRAKESARVLEEFSKLVNAKAALRFKRVRYRIYALEKKAAAGVSALSAH